MVCNFWVHTLTQVVQNFVDCPVLLVVNFCLHLIHRELLVFQHYEQRFVDFVKDSSDALAPPVDAQLIALLYFPVVLGLEDVHEGEGRLFDNSWIVELLMELKIAHALDVELRIKQDF